jgi:hypothetical protein
VISIGVAEALAAAAHGTDRTPSGELIIEHVRRVASALHDDHDPYAVPAALLHDTVEKGSLGWSDLRAAGADDRLLAVVDALTERVGEPLEAYLARCVADPLALRIKRADIGDKLTVEAHRGLSDDAIDILRDRAQLRLSLLEELAATD